MCIHELLLLFIVVSIFKHFPVLRVHEKVPSDHHLLIINDLTFRDSKGLEMVEVQFDDDEDEVRAMAGGHLSSAASFNFHISQFYLINHPPPLPLPHTHTHPLFLFS